MSEKIIYPDYLNRLIRRRNSEDGDWDPVFLSDTPVGKADLRSLVQAGMQGYSRDGGALPGMGEDTGQPLSGWTQEDMLRLSSSPFIAKLQGKYQESNYSPKLTLQDTFSKPWAGEAGLGYNPTFTNADEGGNAAKVLKVSDEDKAPKELADDGASVSRVPAGRASNEDSIVDARKSDDPIQKWWDENIWKGDSFQKARMPEERQAEIKRVIDERYRELWDLYSKAYGDKALDKLNNDLSYTLDAVGGEGKNGPGFDVKGAMGKVNDIVGEGASALAEKKVSIKVGGRTISWNDLKIIGDTSKGISVVTDMYDAKEFGQKTLESFEGQYSKADAENIAHKSVMNYLTLYKLPLRGLQLAMTARGGIAGGGLGLAAEGGIQYWKEKDIEEYCKNLAIQQFNEENRARMNAHFPDPRSYKGPIMGPGIVR